MTTTNMFLNFGGKWDSAPLSSALLEMLWHANYLGGGGGSASFLSCLIKRYLGS